MFGIDPAIILRGALAVGTLAVVLLKMRDRYGVAGSCALAVGLIAGAVGLAGLILGEESSAPMLAASALGFLGARLGDSGRE